ncbi:MAG: Fe-S cluster assembly protein SufD [Paludibacteraceae bacterium]
MNREQQYIDLYEQTAEMLKAHSATQLNLRRDEAFVQFKQHGFPTNKDEAYLYCPLLPALDTDYGFDINHLTVPTGGADLFRCDVPGIRAHNFYIVNDQLQPTHTALPDGVILCKLSEACIRHADIVAQHLDRQTGCCDDGFTLFNRTFAQDGYFLFVPENTTLDLPIQIVNMLFAQTCLMTHTHNLIVLAAGARLDMLVCDHTTTGINFFANRLTEIVVGPNACLNYYTLESTGTDTNGNEQIFVEQAAGSQTVINLVALHNGRSRRYIDINLNGEQAATWLGGIVIGDNRQQTDITTTIRHNVPRCNSQELFKYILDGESEGAFAGRILVEKNAQHTEAYQTNRNICLTKQARMHAKPQLEIYADDVKCGHGATTGQIDENALFYMRTRGIGEDEARMLLLLAFAADVLDKITVEAVRDRLRLMVEQRLRGSESKCKTCKMC